MSSSNRTRTVDDVIEKQRYRSCSEFFGKQRYAEERNFLEMRNIDNNLNSENS